MSCHIMSCVIHSFIHTCLVIPCVLFYRILWYPLLSSSLFCRSRSRVVSCLVSDSGFLVITLQLICIMIFFAFFFACISLPDVLHPERHIRAIASPMSITTSPRESPKQTKTAPTVTIDIAEEKHTITTTEQATTTSDPTSSTSAAAAPPPSSLVDAALSHHVHHVWHSLIFHTLLIIDKIVFIFVFIVGTINASLLCVGYLLLSIFVLYRKDLYEGNVQRLRKHWRVLAICKQQRKRKTKRKRKRKRKERQMNAPSRGHNNARESHATR